jgi:hypothetical protein
MSALVFLSLLGLHLYFISLVFESLRFIGTFWSMLTTKVRLSTLGDLDIRVLRWNHRLYLLKRREEKRRQFPLENMLL